MGVDIERIISIDNGALRIAPLIRPGFGRAGLVYGPFKAEPGLAFSVYMLNGHNSSQAEHLSDTFKQRLKRWLTGSETDPLYERLKHWIRSKRIIRTFRQFRWWWYTANRNRSIPKLDDNLSVGWFPHCYTSDPYFEGNSFIMHALGPENGALWSGTAVERSCALLGVQNLPLYLIGILRKEGTIYYTASLEGANGFSGYPQIKAVAIDRCPPGKDVFLGIHQSVLGQIGFRQDTRVYGVHVVHVDEYVNWCGGAHAADRLVGVGALVGLDAEVGGKWKQLAGELIMSQTGAKGNGLESIAVLSPNAPSGLIHATAKPGKTEGIGSVGLIWRCRDALNYWKIELTQKTCAIICTIDGKSEVVAFRKTPDPLGDQESRLQVLDNGIQIMGYLNGRQLAESWLCDQRLSEETRTGITVRGSVGGTGAVRDFEAHPRYIHIPPPLDMGSPWLRKGNKIVVADDFSGNCGPLEGRTTSVGGLQWHRLIGQGHFEINGHGAATVVASVSAPCLGRTAYCVDWCHNEFADISATIIPPGTDRGQRHHCTAGFILYQDRHNYVILNIWCGDSYKGASISTFFKFDGFEDLYDAIWTNVGRRVLFGRSSRLRLCCDGERYLAFVDDEPVLFRAFADVYAHVKPIRINKIGIVANWEWGRDTGSRFLQFEALS
ncbi:MAG: nucleotide-binding protein [Pseudomonadota bacterium]